MTLFVSNVTPLPVVPLGKSEDMGLWKVFLQLLLLDVLSSNCSKYDSRWNGPCKILVVDVWFVILLRYNNFYLQSKKGLGDNLAFQFITNEIENYIYVPLRRINCTFDYSIKDWSLGSEINGSYNNIIGQLQRGVN